MPENKIYNASCLCEGVKFDLEGEPFHFVICHCTNCKKISGSAFMSNIMYNIPNVKITQGADLIKSYADGKTLSGNTIARTFCSNCGTTLFIVPAAGNIYITHPALINEKVDWKPKKEFHGNDRWAWIKDVEFRTKDKQKL